MDLSTIDYQNVLSLIISILTTIAATIFFIKRQISKYSVDEIKTESEGFLIKRLEKHLDTTLVELEKVNTKCSFLEEDKIKLLNKVYTLSNEIILLTSQLDHIKEKMAELVINLNSYKDRVNVIEQKNNELIDIIKKHNINIL